MALPALMDMHLPSGSRYTSALRLMVLLEQFSKMIARCFVGAGPRKPAVIPAHFRHETHWRTP